ncbi:HNH endonuclease [Epilithonimonas sp.]|uniref:HNH endonuclease n=1 Tax=Epilithonimonas sp. TaxID=2894511 RepID=UPI0028A1FD5E|nr:HNH endonuclease [Epilithonimonas sp.]
MRPVERGPVPLEADGSNRVYSAYDQARRDLIERMGQYCSYCNQKLPSSLAVEHVQPKKPNPTLELEWTNFLLGCTNCNSTKGKKPVNLTDYLWPDVHNTHIPFTYTPDGKIDVNPLLPDPLKVKAQNMLDLVGLQSYPDNPTASDRRWLNRKDAFVKANIALVLYQSAAAKGASSEFEKALGLWASDNGFFSIWMFVFNAYPNVKEQIILSFTGTAATCFDANLDPVNRTTEL